MVNPSSILSAHPSPPPGQFPPFPLLLIAIVLLALALRYLRRAVEPFAVIMRSFAAAAIAVVCVVAALGLVLLAAVMTQT